MVETKKPKKRYSYIESPNHPKQTCIGINEGKFAGVIYKYGKVKPIEKDGLSIVDVDSVKDIEKAIKINLEKGF